MCNCGKKREVHARQIFSGIANSKRAGSGKSAWDDVPFIFTGRGHFSVKGSITGKTYYFPRNGAIQLIDYRDVSGVRGVREIRAK